MLDHVIRLCERDKQGFDNVYLHVQVNNEAAINFYQHHGFQIVQRKDNYYKRIEPADAFVLQRDLKPCTDVTKREN